MYAEERQQAMAELVLGRGRVSVTDLAAEYDVTTETVRRDLSVLERAGLLRRVHGGAVPAQALPTIEAALAERDTSHTAEKELIAAAAASILPPGNSTIIIDAGSTTVRFAALLPRDRELTVLTHSVPVAGRIALQSNVELHLLPGRVRRTTQAAVGADTIEALSRVRADIVFLGTNGISTAHGLSTPNAAEAATKRAMVASAHLVVVLADSSKFGVESTIRFADLEEVDVVVTDAGIDTDGRKLLETADIEVVVA